MVCHLSEKRRENRHHIGTEENSECAKAIHLATVICTSSFDKREFVSFTPSSLHK